MLRPQEGDSHDKYKIAVLGRARGERDPTRLQMLTKFIGASQAGLTSGLLLLFGIVSFVWLRLFRLLSALLRRIRHRRFCGLNRGRFVEVFRSSHCKGALGFDGGRRLLGR